MTNSVVMKAPSGFTGVVSCTGGVPALSGQTYTPDSNGFVLVDPRDVNTMTYAGFSMVNDRQGAVVATAPGGTTATMAAASVGSPAPASMVVAVTTGGSTPSLTLPLATAMDAALPMMQAGDSYVLRIINSNSGVATIVTNTGWTTSGTLTLATNTWRDFIVKKTATGAYTLTSIGTGANS